MAFRLISVFLCAGLLPSLLWAGPLESDFLYIHYLDKYKEKNGQVCQAFKLICADKMADIVGVYYQENRSPTLYQAGVNDACFTISADRTSRIRVFAIARTTRKTLLAHTDTVLFGRSKTAPERLAADQTAEDFLSIHPHIDLISPDNYYWNQTGQNFLFKIKTPFNANQLHLSVVENGRTYRLVPDQESAFAYVPPHDRVLRRAGLSAFRNDILFTCLSNGASEFNLTYSLMAHRSRHAFDNHAAGTAVFTSSILFFAALVVMKRKTPWWKKSD